MSLYLHCSKEYSDRKISGIYEKLEKRGKYGEDRYINKESRMYLYKIRSDIYAIGTRLGSVSIRGYSHSSNIFEKGRWHVCNNYRKWVLDKDMCVDKEIKEIEKKDKDAMIVYSKYSNIHGGYLKKEKNVYFNEEDDMYLYKINLNWAISPVQGSNRCYMISDESNAESPELADWSKSNISVVSYIKENEVNDNANGEYFIDDDFKADESSLGNEIYKNTTWIRATELQPQSAKMELFHDVEPNDILQGGLGDCWLLCALSCLAEFPNFIKNNIFITKDVSESGKYELKLYDVKKQDWIIVTIDDLIPCSEKKWYDIPRPLFARPNENEMYILLIEKAFAKLSGSYDKLSGGNPVKAWLALTGCEDLHIWCKEKNYWKKMIPAIDKLREDNWNFQKMFIKNVNENKKENEMFSFLEECDKSNYMISGAIIGNIMEKKRTDGLVENHAYSILRIYKDNNIRLIQLRNPWGNYHEWNGDWSDKSSKWNEYPNLAKELDWCDESDGLFWMNWNDFEKIFHNIQIVAKNMK